jgi:hypothetical protein
MAESGEAQRRWNVQDPNAAANRPTFDATPGSAAASPAAPPPPLAEPINIQNVPGWKGGRQSVNPDLLADVKDGNPRSNSEAKKAWINGVNVPAGSTDYSRTVVGGEEYDRARREAAGYDESLRNQAALGGAREDFNGKYDPKLGVVVNGNGQPLSSPTADGADFRTADGQIDFSAMLRDALIRGSHPAFTDFISAEALLNPFVIDGKGVVNHGADPYARAGVDGDLDPNSIQKPNADAMRAQLGGISDSDHKLAEMMRQEETAIAGMTNHHDFKGADAQVLANTAANLAPDTAVPQVPDAPERFAVGNMDGVASVGRESLQPENIMAGLGSMPEPAGRESQKPENVMAAFAGSISFGEPPAAPKPGIIETVMGKANEVATAVATNVSKWKDNSQQANNSQEAGGYTSFELPPPLPTPVQMAGASAGVGGRG